MVPCSGYLKENTVDHVGDGSELGMNVTYSFEEKMLGTRGAIENAQTLLSSESGFYVINGDVLATIGLVVLAGDISGMAAVQMRNPFGVISTADDGDLLA